MHQHIKFKHSWAKHGRVIDHLANFARSFIWVVIYERWVLRDMWTELPGTSNLGVYKAIIGTSNAFLIF